jgi:hypothetical protein
MPSLFKHRLSLLALTALLLAPTVSALAEATLGMPEISTLGQLNGVALACKQMALSNRLREILINSAPKERAIGERFEQASNDAFLAQGNSHMNCPDLKTQVSKIDSAEAALKKVFAKAP